MKKLTISNGSASFNNKIKWLFLIISATTLIGCGGSDTPNAHSSDKKISGKLAEPEGDQIIFGGYPGFGGYEDDVNSDAISNFDIAAGKTAAWSYFSNNWSTYTSDYVRTPSISYPSSNIKTITDSGKVPFVRLLPWSSPDQVSIYSYYALRETEATEVTSACVEPSVLTGLTDKTHEQTVLLTKSELSSGSMTVGYGNDQQSVDVTNATKGPCYNDISMQSIIDGDWDNELKEWAYEAKNDTDKDGKPISLLVTFTVEMNGSWFPWSGIYHGGAENNYKPEDGLADGPERFRDAYRHIIDLFHEEGVTNVTWVFATDLFYEDLKWNPWLVQDWNLPNQYYPGDDYIDWVGFTMYGQMRINKLEERPTDLEVFSEEISLKYHLLENTTVNKPYALIETAMVDYKDGSKSTWLADMFETVLNDDRYSNIKAINYWGSTYEDDDVILNYNIDSSPETQSTFMQLISNPRFTSDLNFNN